MPAQVSNAPAPAAAPTTTSTQSAPSGASTGSTPASTGSSKNLTSSATTQKIDYGMGPKSGDSQPAQQTSDPYGEEFWTQHGEGIFKHQRFKELTGYKKQVEDLAPVKQFVESFGGLEELNAFQQYFGPVFRHLNGAGQNATAIWNQLYPVLQGVLSGEDLKQVYSRLAGANPQAAGQAPAPAADDDPFLQHLKPVQDELNKTKETLGQMQEREKQQRVMEYQKFQNNNRMEYVKLMNAKFADPKDPIPDGYHKLAEDLIVQHIGAHMPIDKRTGQKVNPLDFMSTEAFESVWKNVVLARIREIEGVAKSKFMKANDNGGPAIPDTGAQGRTNTGRVNPSSREDKAALLANRLQRMG